MILTGYLRGLNFNPEEYYSETSVTSTGLHGLSYQNLALFNMITLIAEPHLQKLTYSSLSRRHSTPDIMQQLRDSVHRVPNTG
jgi:hypothetical protein